MPVNLYYTQKVRGFQQTSVKYSKESVEIRLKRTVTIRKNRDVRLLVRRIKRNVRLKKFSFFSMWQTN